MVPLKIESNILKLQMLPELHVVCFFEKIENDIWKF
jgi:hypothetical protein